MNEIIQILESNDSVNRLLRANPNYKKEAKEIVQYQGLPPNGSKKNLMNLLIIEKKNNLTAGFLSFYIGYPNKYILYIGDFFLRPDFQNSGAGSEIVSRLEANLKNSSIKGIRLGVGLKNWKALRFWIKTGFNKIIKMSGDKDFMSDNFAVIELEKSL